MNKLKLRIHFFFYRQMRIYIDQPWILLWWLWLWWTLLWLYRKMQRIEIENSTHKEHRLLEQSMIAVFILTHYVDLHKWVEVVVFQCSTDSQQIDFLPYRNPVLMDLSIDSLLIARNQYSQQNIDHLSDQLQLHYSWNQKNK